MIESEWIFPDGIEYACGGDNLIVHEIAVKYFIRGLQFQDTSLHSTLVKEVDDFYWDHGARSLYTDYAIRRLGWIKVGTSIWHNITYAGYDWQSDLVRPYDESGYHIVNKYFSSSSLLTLKCDILLAIRNGRHHY